MKSLKLILIIIVIVGTFGCAKKTSSPNILTLDNANQKIIQICKDDNKIDVILKPLSNTLWIYVPLNEPFFNYKANSKGPEFAHVASESHIINFLDGQFQNGAFHVEYDITPARAYKKSYGYSSAYTHKYQSIYQGVLRAITNAYADVEKDPDNETKYVRKVIGDKDFKDTIKNATHKKFVHNYVKESVHVPEFIRIVFADITTGIEINLTVTFKDLIRGMTDQSFQEEYSRRAIMDYPQGHTTIIGDMEGKHLDLKEMTWPRFLAKQMVYRIRYKYTRSSFPPSDETQDELLAIIATTVNSYDFKDFTSISLNNLREETTTTIDQEDLDQYLKEKPSKGKLHTIRFF